MSAVTSPVKKAEEVLFKIIESGSRVEHRRVIAGVVPKKTVVVASSTSLKIPSVCRFTTEEGIPVQLRYLADCPEIDYHKQIAKDGKWNIPANRKFTKADRKDLAVYNNLLLAKKPHLIEYLRSVTYNEAWKGGSKDDERVYFFEFKPKEEQKADLKFGFRQTRAMRIVEELHTEQKVDELDTKIIAIHGAHFEIPQDLDDKASVLIQAINDATPENDADLDIIEEETKGDSITQILAKSIAAKIISFDQDPKSVMINKEGKKKAKWEVLKLIPEDYTLEQKLSQVEAWLSVPEGQITLESLKKYLETSKKE